MKKIIFLFWVVAMSVTMSYGQCIQTNQFPFNTITSNNLGLPQTVVGNAYTAEFSKLDNLIIGVDYVFTCKSGNNDKYITVTDWSNNVIAFGPSPLTVTAITSSTILLHYTENEQCLSGYSPHIVTIQALTNCSPPIDLDISGITTTSAAFSWTPQGTEASWQTLILPEGSPTPTASTVGTATSVTTATANTLLPGTAYNFYVRANCGTEFSPWNGPLNFSTLCLAVTAFNETFETTAVGEIPTCWSSILTGTNLGDATIGVEENGSVSGTKAIALKNNNASAGSNIILVSPNLNNVGAGTHRLKFFAETFDAALLQVGTIDNATNNGVFNVISTIDLTNDNSEYTIDFSSYTGTDQHIAFRNNSEITYSSIFIDDIRWELTPLCDDVTNIAVNETTDTTAAFTWVNNGTETQWQVVYGPITVNDPNTLVPLPTVNAIPGITITNLTANTQYNVWVRSVCGGTDGNGTWIGPLTFSTTCEPIATFQENFESTTGGVLPSCWTAIEVGNANYSGVSLITYGGNSGSNAVQLSNANSNVNATIMLVSPKLSTLTTGTHRLKLFANSYTQDQTVEIGTVDNPNTSGVFSTVETITLGTTYQEYTIDFTDYEGTDTFVAIKHPNTVTYTSIFIDDVRWELAPLCEDVENLEVTEVTTSTATITWDAQGGENAWDVVYGLISENDPNTLTPITPSVSTVSETTLTNLSANTTYKVWVRSVCGEPLGNGAWIGPLLITTSCLATDVVNENFDTTDYQELPSCFSSFISGPTVDPFASVYTVQFNGNSGTNSVQLYSGTSSGTDDYVVLVLPNLSTLSTATHRLKFYAKAGFGGGTVDVGTLNGTTNTSQFTTYEEATISENYAEYIIEFTSYSGTDTFVGIRNTSAAYTSIFIDDVRWEIAPTCADVDDIVISNITTNSANLEWTAQGLETQWDVVVGNNATTDPNTLTPISPTPSITPSATLTGLTENTTYKVWIRSVCGGTDGNGAWMGPITFTTQCNATSVPFIQNFDTASVPNLPNCSLVENLGAGNTWTTAEINQYGFTGKVLNYSYTCAAAANTWYYTQGLTLTAGVNYKISYKYGSNSTFYNEKLKVAYGTSPNADDMTEPLADHPTVNFNTAVTNEVIFTPNTTDTYYFGFQAYSDSCQYFLYVDDIAVETNLDTPAFSLEKIVVYPNPVKDILHINHNETITNVSIYTILGQNIIDKSYNTTKVQVDLSALPSGTYLVKSTTDNQVHTTKITKQ